MTTTLMTPDDLAAYLGVPVKTIYQWGTTRKGPRRLRVGKHVRFRPADVEAWLDEQADR